MRHCSLLLVILLAFSATACNRPRTANGQDSSEPQPVAKLNENAVTPPVSAAEKRYEKYREETEKSIDGFGAQIETLASQASDAAAETKAQIYQQLAKLYSQQEAINDRLKELRRSGAEKYQEIKPSLDEAVKKLQSELATAQSNIEKGVKQAKESVAFSKTRQEFEEYQAKVQKSVADLDQKIETMLSHANKASKDARAEVYTQLANVYEQRGKVRDRLQELRGAAGDAWQEMRSGVDQAINDLGSAISRASEKLQK